MEVNFHGAGCHDQSNNNQSRQNTTNCGSGYTLPQKVKSKSNMNNGINSSSNHDNTADFPTISKHVANSRRQQRPRSRSLRNLLYSDGNGASRNNKIMQLPQVCHEDDSSNRTASTRSTSTVSSSSSHHSLLESQQDQDALAQSKEKKRLLVVSRGSELYREEQRETTSEKVEEHVKVAQEESLATVSVLPTKERATEEMASTANTKKKSRPDGTGTRLVSRGNSSRRLGSDGDSPGGRRRFVVRVKGKVRFAPTLVATVATVPCLSEVSSEERWETWWCPHEYQAIRLAAKYTTKQIRKSNDLVNSECVQRTFTYTVQQTSKVTVTGSGNGGKEETDVEEAEHGDEYESEEGDTDVVEESMFPSPALSKTKKIDSSSSTKMKSTILKPRKGGADESTYYCSLLESWCTAKLPTRGLEKYVSPQHKKDRVDRMNESRRVVAELSASYYKDKEQQGNDTGRDLRKVISMDDLQSEIAQVYSDQVQYAHLFARFMGQADSKAAQQAVLEMEDCDDVLSQYYCSSGQHTNNFSATAACNTTNVSKSTLSPSDAQHNAAALLEERSESSMVLQRTTSSSTTGSMTSHDSLLLLKQQQVQRPMARTNVSSLSSSLHVKTNARLRNHHQPSQHDSQDVTGGTRPENNKSTKNAMRRNSSHGDLNKQTTTVNDQTSSGDAAQKTHLQQSFLKQQRRVVSRRASSQGLVSLQYQQQEKEEHSSTGQDMKGEQRSQLQKPLHSSELLKRSDSRRSLLMQNRPGSFRSLGGPSQAASVTSNSSSEPSQQQRRVPNRRNSTNNMLVRSNSSRRNLMKSSRQDSMSSKRSSARRNGQQLPNARSVARSASAHDISGENIRRSSQPSTTSETTSMKALASHNVSSNMSCKIDLSCVSLSERRSSMPNMGIRHSVASKVDSLQSCGENARKSDPDQSQKRTTPQVHPTRALQRQSSSHFISNSRQLIQQ